MKKVIKFTDVNDEPETKIEEVKKDPNSNYLPIETLPSKYKHYSVSNILARPLNVSEVKLLASMDSNNYDFIMNDILKRSTKMIDVGDIFVSDKYFIIFWLRANTYKNSGYEMDFQCGTCNKNSKYNFNVDVLDVEYIKDSVNIDEEKALPNSGDKIVIKYKRIKDETKLKDFIKRSKNTITKYDEEILDIASSVSKINGEEMSLLNKYEFVEKMHPVDFSFLISYIDSVSFGVKHEIKALCGDCKEVTPIGVTFRPEFFIPKYTF